MTPLAAKERNAHQEVERAVGAGFHQEEKRLRKSVKKRAYQVREEKRSSHQDDESGVSDSHRGVYQRRT